MRQMDVLLEISLWHNGQPVSPTGIVYTSRIAAGSEESWWLHNPSGGKSQYQVRMRWTDETFDDWYTGELWLLDDRGAPMGSPRPALVYTGASDVPTSTCFVCGWKDHVPSKAGVWSVLIRRADTTYKLKEKYSQE